MLSQVHTWLEQEITSHQHSSYLLAVSGGVDSMTLFHLFDQLKLNYQVAHVNFQLRPTATRDEEFVRVACQQKGCKFHLHRFDTSELKKTSPLSTQDLARQLRYTWFDELMRTEHIDYLVTAHHQSDQLETFFINLIRHSGLKGLAGIPPVRGKILRPLLLFTKEEIVAYARINHVGYMDDPTNETDSYLRNRVRHHLFPALTKVDPRAMTGVNKSVQALRNDARLFQELIAYWETKIRIQNNPLIVDLRPLKDLELMDTLLFKILQPFGLRISQCRSIATAFRKAQSGKIFKTAENTFLLDRSWLKLLPLEESYNQGQLTIDIPSEINFVGQQIIFSVKTYREGDQIPTTVLCLDADKIQTPLALRHHLPGDRFSPLGMNGKTQKIQDFLTNLKLSIDTKSKTLVLVDGDKLAAVIPHRIDDYYKITPNTKKMLVINWTDMRVNNPTLNS